MDHVLSETATLRGNSDGSKTVTVAAGPLFFQDDEKVWQEIDVTDAVDLGTEISYRSVSKNCEVRYFKDHLGYRVWKPNGVPPYEPEWTASDYWLQVDGPTGTLNSQVGNWVTYTDANGTVTKFPTGGLLIGQQTRLVNAQTVKPTWTITWSSNLSKTEQGGGIVWKNAAGVVVFEMKRPLAWTEGNEVEPVAGTATVNQAGVLAITVDLTGLSYPIILDPTTAFNATTDDRSPYKSGTATWTLARTAPSDAADDNVQVLAVRSLTSAGTFETQRGLIPFDTSAIGAGATITDVTLTLYAMGGGVVNADAVSLTVVAGSYPVPPGVSNYSDLAFVSCGSVLYSAWADLDNNANVITLNATGIAAVDKTGTTKLALVASLDLSNAVPPTGTNSLKCKSSNHVDNKPPVLSVTFTAAPPPGAATTNNKKSAVKALKPRRVAKNKIFKDEMAATLEGLGF